MSHCSSGHCRGKLFGQDVLALKGLHGSFDCCGESREILRPEKVEVVLITTEDVPAPAASKSEDPATQIPIPYFTEQRKRTPLRCSTFIFQVEGGANVSHVMPSSACPPRTHKRDKKGRYPAASNDDLVTHDVSSCTFYSHRRCAALARRHTVQCQHHGGKRGRRSRSPGLGHTTSGNYPTVMRYELRVHSYALKDVNVRHSSMATPFRERLTARPPSSRQLPSYVQAGLISRENSVGRAEFVRIQ
ncbi:hypothetical protein EDB86DRAFT_2005605 [Lactarius hatsudake]|nr:hypothetical protein EDB86DRAFT_2005605 [Lactarius hatsudake]